MDIYSELLKHSPLEPLQAALISHITKLMGFAESVTRHHIRVFTPLIPKQQHSPHKILCVEYDNGELQTIQSSPSTLWNRLLSQGVAIHQYDATNSEYVYPIVDNGGKIIGGISFAPMNDSSTDQHQLDIILSDTMQRLMLTATDEQMDDYEPISYLDGLIIFDQNGTILYGNDGALHLADLLGVDRRLIGTSIFSSALKMSAIHHVLSERVPHAAEEIYHHMVIKQQMIPIPMGRNETRCLLILHDCTRESKQQQELLVKNSIIKEIHHRVKNNLQTVAGLLRMEARRSDSDAVKLALQESISRIESMALVHDLVAHYDEDYISIRSIYDELCRLLRRSMVDKEQQVEFRFVGDEFIVSSHAASYISLVINELITNSLEHGLKGNNGAIVLEVNRMNDAVILRLKDDGKGFPDGFKLEDSKRLGMQIIKNLVTHELEGTIETTNNGGAEVIITISKEL